MEIKTDFLVIGSGLSGLWFSLNASKYGKCIIATKDAVSESSTKYAQGGIAAVFGENDSFESHIKDTLIAGAGLCNEKNARIMAENGPAEIKRLISYGVNFDRNNGKLELGREGAHSSRRILHHKDATGAEVENKLARAINSSKNISIKEKIILIRLLAQDRKCYGALFLDLGKNSLISIESKCTILATGGIGQAYENTTNPKVATGDGIAAAFEAGAKVENMEFVQFHPTALNVDADIKPLISEALRGEGAFIVNSKSQRFVRHELKELAPRDILAREIFMEMKANKVFLDISHKDADFIKSRFPNIYKKCLDFGIDITKDKIPITPAAHFLCGGIKTDSYGQTSIKNLFAIGECACTGVHGANRLASNSLLECLVFSSRAAEKAKETQKCLPVQLNNSIKNNSIKKIHFKIKKINEYEEKELMLMQEKLKNLMWAKAGIIRTKMGLKSAFHEVALLEKAIKKTYKPNISKSLIETKNMLIVARLIIKASLKRRESVGCFYLENE